MLQAKEMFRYKKVSIPDVSATYFFISMLRMEGGGCQYMYVRTSNPSARPYIRTCMYIHYAAHYVVHVRSVREFSVQLVYI